jgi:hypothetical protein
MQEVGGSIPPGSTTLRPSGYAWRSHAGAEGQSVPGVAPFGRRRADATVLRGFLNGTSVILSFGVRVTKMWYVYILRSINNPDQEYIGATADLKRRLSDHNAGKSAHTA